MLKNYFNIAIRNLTKHKFYSVINILGLSIGLACFLFIALFIRDELTYDQHHPDASRIQRIDFSGTINGNEFVTALMCSPGAQTFKEDYPDVEDAFRFRSTGNWFVKQQGKEQTFKFGEGDVAYADDNFFQFWSTELIYGDPETCLLKPKTLVIDQTTSEKIFGKVNPVGEMVILDNEEVYEVAGVYADFPRTSHFHYNIMITLKDHHEYDQKMWLSFNFNTYLKFTEGADTQAFLQKMPGLIESKMGPDIQKFMNASFEDFLESGNRANFYLTPLNEIHLYSNKLGDIETNGDIKYVYIFAAIGAFILLLACINFMNLATARSAGRAKEVGVRKVMGALKHQLVRQFLSEAFVISILSTVIAFVLGVLLLPYFNEISGKVLSESDLFSGEFLLIMSVITIVVGLLAGSYPAFYLSGFRPVETLKGRLNLGMKSGGLRSALVVLQFAVSITMIIGTAIVYDQLAYIQNKKLGFNKEQVVAVDDVWILNDKKNTFKQEALRDSRLIGGALATFVPIGSQGNNSVYWKGDQVEGKDTYVINHRRVDHDYLSTMQMQIMDGRDFSRDFATDSLGVIVNESLLNHMGIEDPLGAMISTYENFHKEPQVVNYRIIGVVADFHYESMKENIQPLLFKLDQYNTDLAVFRFNTSDTENIISSLRETWNDLAPGQPFEYYFLDQKFDQFYNAEQRVGKIFGVFAFIAIFIACLGLFGLASFTAEQRIKEIGIRKVLGASVTQIVNMLSWNFIKLVGIAFVVAAPLAYFGMRSWLDDFAYRTDIKVWIFVAAGLAATVIAWLTMGFQSWRAARVNPAKSLRNE